MGIPPRNDPPSGQTRTYVGSKDLMKEGRGRIDSETQRGAGVMQFMSTV